MQTIIDKGAAYTQAENVAAMEPTNSFLLLPCRAVNEITTTAVKNTMPPMNNNKILLRGFGGANMRNMHMYMNSIAAPLPFMVVTRIL